MRKKSETEDWMIISPEYLPAPNLGTESSMSLSSLYSGAVGMTGTCLLP